MFDSPSVEQPITQVFSSSEKQPLIILLSKRMTPPPIEWLDVNECDIYALAEITLLSDYAKAQEHLERGSVKGFGQQHFNTSTPRFETDGVLSTTAINTCSS